MLRLLSSSDDNGQTLVIHPSYMKHAPSVVIVWWQRTEHGYSTLRYEICSVTCHRLIASVRVWWYSLKYESYSVSCNHLMTTNTAWLFIHTVFNMLCQLSSSHNNSQSTAALRFLRVLRKFCDFMELSCDSLASVNGLLTSALSLPCSYCYFLFQLSSCEHCVAIRA